MKSDQRVETVVYCVDYKVGGCRAPKYIEEFIKAAFKEGGELADSIFRENLILFGSILHRENAKPNKN